MQIWRAAEIGEMDDLGRQDSGLHRLDARVKIITVLAFIITVLSFPPHAVSGLMPLFIFPAVLISTGRIPPRSILGKIVLASPFALMAGLFNPLLDREPALYIGNLAVSGGWVSFCSIMLRFALTVSAALILIACTGINRLCAALEQLGVPRVFAVQILFLYRYLFVITEEARQMIDSIRMRSAGQPKLNLRTYGALTGHLLIRSAGRARRISRAMEARGFDGQIRLLCRTPQSAARNLLFPAGWILFFILIRIFNPALLLGRLLTG